MSVPALPNTSRLGVCWRSGLAGQGVHQLEQRATFRTQYIPIVAAGRPCCRTEIELEQTAVGEDRGMRCLVIGFLLALPLSAARLTPETMAAFERYIRQTEQRLDERKPFLWADESPDRARLVRQGQVVVEPVGPSPTTPVPDGLVHDWVGAVFIPGATLERTLAVMEDYNHKEAYRPEIMESRILSGDGHDFRVYMRLLKKKVITVVLDSEHDIHYYPVDKTRWRARSRTTRVQEVDHAGKSDESLKPPGTGQGFLWHLYTYWRIEERDGGTWVECEAVSLTRDVPTGLGWLINPIIQDLPKESLENSLRQTRDAVGK